MHARRSNKTRDYDSGSVDVVQTKLFRGAWIDDSVVGSIASEMLQREEHEPSDRALSLTASML